MENRLFDADCTPGRRSFGRLFLPQSSFVGGAGGNHPCRRTVFRSPTQGNLTGSQLSVRTFVVKFIRTHVHRVVRPRRILGLLDSEQTAPDAQIQSRQNTTHFFVEKAVNLKSLT